MEQIEQTGKFYLGKVVDEKTQDVTDKLLMYDAKDLTTHAVILGMTGSGKTGLGITLLEEAGLQGIPAIIIDPKGDLSNLALTFPNLSADAFLPWVDASANRETAAAKEAKSWKDGLAEWGETPSRIQKFKSAAVVEIYTPASDAGVPISILSSFAAPSKEFVHDTSAFRDRVLSLTSSLLSLIGINADPIKSREHILISTIIDKAWRDGVNLDIKSLIQQVQKPPFNQVGVLDLDTFFPKKERMDLSVSLNNLLASPGFQAWMKGEPLDISQLLYTKDKKPKLAIFSIAHLSDTERMFFVTLLLNEILAWLRRQTGTSALRALLYMDEIFGYFPPTSAPPSKLAMLTLLKQARAYGFGVVLATQNPVDLDYKGLSNCGTWFIGKLQTERDKARVKEGLTLASNGEVNTEAFNNLLSNIGKRNFIMRSIYEKNPIMFKTRWTLSYLRGPLTLAQIGSLTDKSGQPVYKEDVQPVTGASNTEKPDVSSDITEYFVSLKKGQQFYAPEFLGLGKLHYVDSKQKIDVWKDIGLLAPADEEGNTALWSTEETISDLRNQLEKTPLPNSLYAKLPAGMQQVKNYPALKKVFELYLYQTKSLELFHCTALNLFSKDDESEQDFRQRITEALKEQNAADIQKINDKYSKKIATLTNKVKSCETKASQKQQQSTWSIINAILSFGSVLLGAFMGRRLTKTTINQAGTSIRRAGKIGKDHEDASQAEENLQTCQQDLDEAKKEMQAEIDAANAHADAATVQLDTYKIPPRKSDIMVENVAIAWVSK